MGIDWLRMRPKRGAKESELYRLADQQAEAFQRLPSLWSTELVAWPVAIESGEQCRLRKQYRESSEALRELLVFSCEADPPGSSYEDCTRSDCWRVYPITHNSTFPIPWRVQAHRTYLPGQLREQFQTWKKWNSAVSAGQYRNYLLRLYLYTMAIQIHGFHQHIRSIAEKSLAQSARWASKPGLVKAREQILCSEAIPLHPAPILPFADTDCPLNFADEEACQSMRKKNQELIELACSWNAQVRQSWKMRCDGSCQMTFDQFLAQANDAWLQSFLEWAESCSRQEMGLFLDY